MEIGGRAELCGGRGHDPVVGADRLHGTALCSDMGHMAPSHCQLTLAGKLKWLSRLQR